MYEHFDLVQQLLDKMQNVYRIADASMDFYRRHVNNFFRSHMDTDANQSRKLDAITYHEIDEYLADVQCSPAEKVNYYNSFKRFFNFTYRIKATPDIMMQVTKPACTNKNPSYLPETAYEALVSYLSDQTNKIVDRLILGMLIYTGLSRQHIAFMLNEQLVYDKGVYKIKVWNDNEEVLLPLKTELQIIVSEYKVYLSTKTSENVELERIFTASDDNYLSTFVSTKMQAITGKRYQPTVLSNTFIKKALLNGNRVWEISKLTLKDISTIEKHIGIQSDVERQQIYILNSF